MMRFYRALLHLYPRSFRGEYGDELAAVFAARRAGESGALAAIASMLMAFADVVPNAIAEHWEILRQDLRYTMRTLRNAPGFAITAILVVALGVGANTAAFSVADFALLRPLPFPDPDRLVKVWQTTPGYGHMEFSPANFRDLRTNARSFAALGAYMNTAVNLIGSGEPVRLAASGVTAEMLPLLGVQPVLGRLFTVADTAAAETVVLSYDLWQTEFGGETSALGKRLHLDGRPYTVIGVMPHDFHFPTRDVALWTPLSVSSGDLADRSNTYIYPVGRLAAGVTVPQALAEAKVIAAQLERQYPKDNEHVGMNLYRLSDELSQRTRLLLLALCGAALCTLLLACANLASLLLARAVSREREIAVRAALGAGRERIVRQVVTESITLAVLGGIVGVFVAVFTVPMLTRLVPDTLPISQQPTVDLRVLCFAAAAAALTGLGFGIVPALIAGGPRSMLALRDGARSGGGRRQRVRGLLVAVELMASVVLLVSSGLLVRAMWRLQSVDPGFRTAGVLTARTALPMPKYANPVDRNAFYTRVLSELRAQQGVQNAAYITGLPMAMRGGIWQVKRSSDAPAAPNENSVILRFATPQYFSTLQIPILAGRDIAESDDASHPYAAVVSQSFVKKFFPGENPIGKSFFVAFHDRVIVGVAADVRVRGLEQESEPQVYLSPKRVETASMPFYTPKDLVVRSTLPTPVLLAVIRRIVHAADPQQPISNVQTLDQVVSNETASRAAQLRVLAMLAAIALLLAGVGIHGLLSFTVSRRTQEIGVRVALGAQSREIVGMIMREGMLLALLGIVPGLAIGLAAGRAMEALLVGIRPNDPMTLSIATALCAAVTLIGCGRPALRAARVDPMAALRAE